MESFERTCGRPLIFRGVMGGKSHDELVAHAKSVGKDFQREKATEQYACLVSEVMDYCAVLIAEGDPFISLTDGGGILSEFSAARRKKLEQSDEAAQGARHLPDYAGRLRHLPGHRGDGHRRPAGNGGQGRDAAAVDAGFLGAAPAGAAADRNIKGGGR